MAMHGVWGKEMRVMQCGSNNRECCHSSGRKTKRRLFSTILMKSLAQEGTVVLDLRGKGFRCSCLFYRCNMGPHLSLIPRLAAAVNFSQCSQDTVLMYFPLKNIVSKINQRDGSG